MNANNVDLRASFAWSRTGAQGTLYGSAVVRRQANGSDYRLKVVSGSSGAIQLVVVRKVGATEAALRSVILSGVTQATDTQYRVAFRAVTTAGTTTLNAKLWRAGTVEPTTWAATVTDSTAQLQGGGSIGFSSYLSSGAHTAVTMRVDDLTVVEPG